MEKTMYGKEDPATDKNVSGWVADLPKKGEVPAKWPDWSPIRCGCRAAYGCKGRPQLTVEGGKRHYRGLGETGMCGGKC